MPVHEPVAGPGPISSLLGGLGRRLRRWPAASLLAIALLAAAIAALPPRAAHTAASSGQQPNIVLVLTDDQRADELAHMPTVQQQITAKGVTFSRGFVVNSLCCPSRASILTGKYSHGTGVYTNFGPHGGFQSFQPEDGATIATWLKAAGYQTALVGKYMNEYGPSQIPYVPPGWDQWDALALSGDGNLSNGYYNYYMSVNGTSIYHGSTDADYSTDVLKGYATSFINNAPRGHPLFLYFAPRAPHSPSYPPSRYSTLFSTVKAARPPSYNEADVSDKPAWVRSLPLLTSAQDQSEDALRRRHFQALLAVDDAVKAILNALSSTGRLSNTLIMFTSDNGLNMGEHRWRNQKEAPYEESIHVPLIVRYDPVTGLQARTDGHLALNIDFAPTFAAAAGVAAPGADGTSLLPLLSGSSVSWRSDFLIEHLADAPQTPIPSYCAVRNQRYIYVKYGTGEEELYDLQADPYELVNRASDPTLAGVKSSMHTRLLTLCMPPPPGYTP